MTLVGGNLITQVEIVSFSEVNHNVPAFFLMDKNNYQLKRSHIQLNLRF